MSGLEVKWVKDKAIELGVLAPKDTAAFAAEIRDVKNPKFVRDDQFSKTDSKLENNPALKQLNEKAQQELDQKYIKNFGKDVNAHEGGAFWKHTASFAAGFALLTILVTPKIYKYKKFGGKYAAAFAVILGAALTKYSLIKTKNHFNTVHNKIPDRDQYTKLHYVVHPPQTGMGGF